MNEAMVCMHHILIVESMLSYYVCTNGKVFLNILKNFGFFYVRSTAFCTRFIVFSMYRGSVIFRVIALLGHALAHRPHPLQLSLRTALLLRICIPSRKQALVHCPHPVHASVTVTVIPGIFL